MIARISGRQFVCRSLLFTKGKNKNSESFFCILVNLSSCFGQ